MYQLALIASSESRTLNRIRGLLGFSAALQLRFERTGSLNNLNDAIVKGAEALEIASSDAPPPWLYLDQMGSTYLC